MQEPERPAYEYDVRANHDWALGVAQSNLAQWAVRCVNLQAATNNPQAVWEPFQLDYLNEADGETEQQEQRLIANSKARQCGFSWLLALESIGRAAVYPGSLTNIVSFNRDEAEEKIRYARVISDSVYLGERLSWTTDNRGELQASNGSRIRSQACTPPRGRPGANHRLDEVAHYQRPQEIYDAAFAGTGRAGSVTCCSSPWVRGGFHYTLMEEPAKYPDFHRMWVPWWAVFGFCTNSAAASLEAPRLTTHERVERFGSERLQRLFRNMPLESFQVECELAYADDSLAWITWDEIVSCTGADTMPYVIAEGLDEGFVAARRLATDGRRGPIYAGYDVARKRDLAVLSLMEQIGDTLVCFALILLPACRFQDQKALLQEITPLIRAGCIDETGLGMNLAEDMRQHSFRWSGVTFTAPSKAQLAGDLREVFQAKGILIPPDRDLQRDLHSVQRIVTAANNIIFNADREDGDGHADRFWALALGVHAAVREARGDGSVASISLVAATALDRELADGLKGAQVTDELGRPISVADLEAKIAQHAAAGEAEWEAM